MNPAQESRESLVKRLRDMSDTLHRDLVVAGDLGMATDLRQAANEIESLGPIAEAAKDVWAVASSKGQLFSSDEQDSDKLVGFFVPAWVMNKLGKSFLPPERTYGG